MRQHSCMKMSFVELCWERDNQDKPDMLLDIEMYIQNYCYFLWGWGDRHTGIER